ncbi:MAG: ABC transporter ATP-binding protein, partial [Thermoleophilia bacterium]
MATLVEPAARPGGAGLREPVLEIDGLNIVYDTEEGPLNTVRDVSLTVRRGESLGLVGESGSGKSTLVMGAIGYLAANGHVSSGSVRLLGEEIARRTPSSMQPLWGSRIAVVYQNPLSALNPSIRIGKQLAEVARLHLGMDAHRARHLTLEMLTKVAMPDPENIFERYPHQVSGGMLQRCVIAMALMARPALLIMDEPTTALDVTTQAVVLDLVAELKGDIDSAIVYITHDLGVVARICDHIAVMYAGEIMEKSPLRQTFTESLHPYTRSLLSCVPRFDVSCTKQPLPFIPGHIPRANELPGGCIFEPRCQFAEEACRTARPALRQVAPERWTACRRWGVLPSWDRSCLDALAAAESQSSIRDGDRLIDAVDIAKHYSAAEGGLRLRRRDRRVVHALDATSLWIGRG